MTSITHAELADDDGSDSGATLVGVRPIGNDGDGITLQTKLDYLGTFAPEHRRTGDDPATTDYLSMTRAFNALGASAAVRTQPDGFPNYGFGIVNAPKGILHSNAGFDYSSPLFGLSIRGVAPYATAFTTDSTSGHGFRIGPYDGVAFSDLLLRNKANSGVSGASDTSAGILLESTGGGGFLDLKRLAISGYHTGIAQDAANLTNGDKALVENVHVAGSRIFYDQGTNKQSVGWSFLNCAGDAKDSHFKLGGAGQTLIVNYTSDVANAFIELPNGAGNHGDFPGTFLGQTIQVLSTKLEYSGVSTDTRRLVDARASTTLGDASGGSAAVLTFRDVHFASGTAPPAAPDDNTVIEIGASGTGSDGIRIHQDGGWIEGTIKYNCQMAGEIRRRWSFRNAIRAPLPEKAQFLGSGAHCLVEWRSNENVRLDQYRGGQSAQVSIDAQKALLLPLQGKYLIDTRDAAYQTDFSGRKGRNFTIPIPNSLRASGAMGGAGYAVVPQLALEVFINNETGTHSTDVQVTQYADNNFTTAIGSVTIGSGNRGLFQVHATRTNVTNGEIYVRVTKPAINQYTEGRLALIYFPYLGS